MLVAFLLQRSVVAYFKSGWHVVDFASVVLMMTVEVLWWDFVVRQAIPFDISLR